MQPPRRTPRAHPSQRALAGRGRWIASGVGLALIALAVLTLPRYIDRRARTRYKAALHARAEALVRWKGWLETGACLRRDDGARWLPAVDKLAEDGSTEALRDAAAPEPLTERRCVTALTPLETDPRLSAEAQAAVHDWLAADRAIDQAAAPAQLRRQLEARDRVRARVRTTLVPAVRAEIRKVQDDHATAHDYVWWRLELGLLLEDLLDLGIQAHRDGRDVAAAVSARARSLDDKTREANSLVGVREMSSLGVLARATGDAAWPALQAIEDNGAWTGIEDDNSVFGRMPVEPQGCAADFEQ